MRAKVSFFVTLLLLICAQLGCSSKSVDRLDATVKETSAVYAGPNVNAQVIGRIEGGVKVSAIGKNGDSWIFVSVNGNKGWVQKFNLAINGNYRRLAENSESYDGNQSRFIISAPTSTKLPVDSSFSGCSCAYNLLDCRDFETQKEAQNCMNYCINETRADKNWLDGDSNGVACEMLP
jgi:uncharacterized protein YgiM (DUF1202 family)